MRRIDHSFLVPVNDFSFLPFRGNSQNIQAFFELTFIAFLKQIAAFFNRLNTGIKDGKKDRVAEPKLFAPIISILKILKR